jgi:hypothetical protein
MSFITTATEHRDATNKHGGFKGIDLQFLKGTVVKLADAPVGKRALVKWSNWYGTVTMG